MSENFLLGITLMSIGMGFVLLFLCILIAAMTGMSAIVRYLNKVFPEKVEIVEKKSASKSAAKDDEAVAVALAAIMSGR